MVCHQNICHSKQVQVSVTQHYSYTHICNMHSTVHSQIKPNHHQPTNKHTLCVQMAYPSQIFFTLIRSWSP